jgi:hypothetical protein
LKKKDEMGEEKPIGESLYVCTFFGFVAVGAQFAINQKTSSIRVSNSSSSQQHNQQCWLHTKK